MMGIRFEITGLTSAAGVLTKQSDDMLEWIQPSWSDEDEAAWQELHQDDTDVLLLDLDEVQS